MGWDVTVYGRSASRPTVDTGDTRVARPTTRGLETKSLSTLSYGLTASLDAARKRPDVALVMNVANGFFLPLLEARGIPTLVNVDGIEWERAKWNGAAKRVFKAGAKCTARFASSLVFDARAIEDYWRIHFRAHGHFIPYGGDVPPPSEVPDGLNHRGYVLMVARFVPENTVPEFFEAVPRVAEQYPVVIVGSSGYGGEFDRAAQALADRCSAVKWLGHVSDDSLLLALWQHAGAYFHGHSVGGTNPALVQAMAAGAPVVARDTVYNREVLGEAGLFVEPNAVSIRDGLLKLMSHEEEKERASLANAQRAEALYSWDTICRDYERALRQLI
ncbi:glycosyltransferase [Mycobacterium sp. ITM-2016-00317]|uniref:glycosyltransferase n=1 Tax=Mycobacterium sp. ITM-2016-00317 TaxID=2099694 RepID=UPI0037CC39D4